MANTYFLIASSTVGAGGAASIDFTSIPSTYTDLVVKFSARTNTSPAYNSSFVTFNNSATGYSYLGTWGNSTGIASNASSGAQIEYVWTNGSTSTGSTFSNCEMYIPNYAGSTNKSISFDLAQENNASTTNSALVSMQAGLWSNTAAITSIKIAANAASFVQYSTAYLYGINKS